MIKQRVGRADNRNVGGSVISNFVIALIFIVYYAFASPVSVSVCIRVYLADAFHQNQNAAL